jgi:hypothetical protein
VGVVNLSGIAALSPAPTTRGSTTETLVVRGDAVAGPLQRTIA